MKNAALERTIVFVGKEKKIKKSWKDFMQTAANNI